MALLYKKNPNYNPNDPNSKRYVYTEQAAGTSRRDPGTLTIDDIVNNPDPTKLTVQEVDGQIVDSNKAPAPSAPATPTAPTQPQTQTTVQRSGTPGVTTTMQTQQQPKPITQPLQPGQALPAGYTKIDGARFNTRELQQQNFEDVQQVGSGDGAYLVGKPKTAETAAPADPAQPEAPVDPTGDESMQALAEQAARAGLSLSEYMDLVDRQSLPTPEQSREIRNNLGIPDVVDDLYEPPEQTTQQVYKELYKEAGLEDVKTKIKNIDDAITQKRKDLVTATGELNNNPWISQASRTGRLRILNELALADIQNSLNEKQQYLDVYDEAVDSIESAIIRFTDDNNLERNLTADKLNYLLSEAEREEGLVARTIQQRGLRYVPDYLKTAEETGGVRGSGTQYEYIKGTGDQQGGVFDPLTGEFIPTAGGGGAGTGTGGTGSGGTGGVPGNDPILTDRPTDPSKYIAGYNFTTYATDPNWGNAVTSILTNQVPDINTAADVENYIASKSPNSPLVGMGAAIIEQANQYGVPADLLVAIMQHESQLGTAGAGARTFNPGNIGNVDSGATSNKGSWENGVAALARHVARRKQAAPAGGGEQKSEFDTYSDEQIALSVLPTQLKNSEMELERALQGIRAGLKEGKDPYEIADTLMGYKIENPTPFSESMRQYISIADFSDNDISEMARLINGGNQTTAVAKIENGVMRQARELDPDGYIGESAAKIAIEEANDIKTAIDEAGGALGFGEGTVQRWLKKLKKSDAQKIETTITQAIARMRNQMLGSAVTPSEEKFLAGLIPDLADTQTNFITKLNNLQTNPLLRLNNVRSTYDLPELTEESLFDRNQRVNLYQGGTNLEGMSNDEFLTIPTS